MEMDLQARELQILSKKCDELVVEDLKLKPIRWDRLFSVNYN